MEPPCGRAWRGSGSTSFSWISSCPGRTDSCLGRSVRASGGIGIIAVTGRSDMVDTVVGLEVGADDYISKPFHLREILAASRAFFAACGPRPPDPARRSGSTDGALDLGRARAEGARREGGSAHVGEFDLLVAFTKHPGRVLNRARWTWTRGRQWEVFDRTIDAQVARLRRKIEPDPRPDDD